MAPPSPLRRNHSLEFEQIDSLDIDIHAAAQMVEFFDVEKFLNDVSTPVSKTPGPQASGEVKSGNLVHGGAPFLTALSGVELTEIVTTCSEGVSEASDDSATELMDSVRVANKAPSLESSDDTSELKKTQRKSRKEEIIELRESVEVLTDQLEALKDDPPQETELSLQNGNTLPKRCGSSLWKHVAIRQLGRRRKAEEDNVMLREMLEMQVQEAKCLQRILKRRTKIQMMEDMLGMKRRKNARISSAPGDNSQIFIKMLRETDQFYSCVDNHFVEKGVNCLPCPGQKRKINRSAVNGVIFEIMSRNLLPFSLQNTGKIARVILNDLGSSGLKMVKDINKQIDFHSQETEESRDTLATSYFSATPGDKEASGAQVWKVMRMYIEEDYAVFIWKMVAEPKLRGSNASIGYQLQSTLQVVMRPGESPTLTGDESTQLLIHFSASRHDMGIPISAKFREPGHMDSGIALWEKLIAYIPHGIESALIDDKCGTVRDQSSAIM